jgi:Fe2+ transport system protein B
MAKKVKSKIRTKRDSERHAFSTGILFAILTLIFSVSGRLFGSFSEINNFIFDLFSKVGYDITLIGIILGILYSFVFGFVLGGAYSIIYNWLPSSKK